MHRTLGDFLTDLFQNAVEASGTVIRIELSETLGWLKMTVTDNGRGMDAEEQKRAQDPFQTDGKKHPGRKVGLGLPFVIQTLEATGGDFHLSSAKGQGTSVTAVFNLKHWDTPPQGDWPVVLGQLIAWPGDFEVVLDRCVDVSRLAYQVSRSELREALGSFEDVEALVLLKEYFRSQESTEDKK